MTGASIGSFTRVSGYWAHDGAPTTLTPPLTWKNSTLRGTGMTKSVTAFERESGGDLLAIGTTGPYPLHSAITKVHDEAESIEATDWFQFEMAGDRERAVVHYHMSAKRTASVPERNYLVGGAVRAAAG